MREKMGIHRIGKLLDGNHDTLCLLLCTLPTDLPTELRTTVIATSRTEGRKLISVQYPRTPPSYSS